MTAEQQGVSPATAGGASAPGPWDIGHSPATGGRNLYVRDSDGDVYVGVIFEPADARRIVEAMNAAERPRLADPRDAEIKRLRAELDKVSGGWEARVESRQKLVQERDQARAELDRLRASNYADEQLRFDAYAELLNVLDEGRHPPVGTGTFREVRAAIVKALDLRAQYKTERDEARVERDRLRTRLDQHLADENSAQAANDRLRQELDLQHADRLRWLCEALNLNPANETWLTAMRRVRHLRQNFSDSPRCEVSESDGWRCRLFAGHDGKHLAQMPTGERREWPFDNRLTPRYWRAGDPEPEIGTTVRYVNHATWPTQTRRTDGQWHCDAGTRDPNTCTESELYSWEQITARSKLMPLVEVAANSKAGA